MGMLGLDIMDMIPGSALEGMIQDHATEITGFLVELAKSSVPWQAGEVPGFVLFVKKNDDGTETIGVLVQALDSELDMVRDVCWYDLKELLRTVPIAAWMKKGKAAKKLAAAIEKAEAERVKHFAQYGDDAHHAVLKGKVDDLRTQLDQLAKSFKAQPAAGAATTEAATEP